MKLKYCSVDKNYHYPVGALPLNVDLLLRVEATEAQRIILVLTKDNETPVEYEFSLKRNIFELKLKITTAGLYFYILKVFEEGEWRTYGRDNFQRAVENGKPFVQLVYKYYPRPVWLNGGIVYQIFPDRFAIGGERYRTKPKELVYRDDWGAVPEFEPKDGVVLNNDMFGGNFKGIIAKADYLAELGVTCIYLNPIFDAFSNHKYNTADYLKTDSDFGTSEQFEQLCKVFEQRGINVILDGVFSHTGDDSVYFDRYDRYGGGAYHSENSEYYAWYKFIDYPDNYECWWGIKTLPNVDETNPSYIDFITDKVIPMWINKGVKGFRLDVADELPDGFLDALFQALYGTDSLIIGEVWENAATKISYGQRRRYLCGGQLDGVINYPLRDVIIAFVKNRDSDKLISVMYELINDYPAQTLNNLFNILSTHDTVRILNALSDDAVPSTKRERATYRPSDMDRAKRRLKLAVGLQYTLPGVPCVFYGDEAGMTGYEDPFCRGCYPWGKEDKELVEYYKRLAELRKNAAFSSPLFDVICSDEGMIIFTRGENKQKITVIVNAGKARTIKQYDGYFDIFSNKDFDGKVEELGFYTLYKVTYRI